VVDLRRRTALKRTILVGFLTLVLSGLVPAAALAGAGGTFHFDLEVPNISQASNGDRVAITGEGEFDTSTKSAEGGGMFVHTTASGAVFAAGTWRATELLEYQSYGCGVVHNFPTPGATTPLPPNFCGGAAKMRIVATPNGTTLQIPAILTIFCIIGPNPPNSHDDPTGEGIHLVVPEMINFNQIVQGMNVFIQES
jgi:hypothetical protein